MTRLIFVLPVPRHETTIRAQFRAWLVAFPARSARVGQRDTRQPFSVARARHETVYRDAVSRVARCAPGTVRARPVAWNLATEPAPPAPRRRLAGRTVSSSSAAASAGSGCHGSWKGPDIESHARRPHEPPPLPAAALPGRDRDPLGGEIAPPLRGISASTRNVDVDTRRGHRVRSRPPDGRRRPARRHRVRVPVRQPDRRRRVDDVVLRARRARPALAPDEDDRRRAQPATADLRRVRAGRDGADGSRAPAGGSPSPSSVAGRPACEVAGQIAELARRTLSEDFRAIDPASAVVLLFDGRTGDPRRIRRPAVPEGHERARADGRRDPHRDAGDGHRRRRHGRRVPERPGARRDAHGRLGRRRAGLAPGAHPGRRIRRAGRPRRPGRRSSGLHAAGPPRGLRHRRRDGARRRSPASPRSRSSRRRTSRGAIARASTASRARPFRYRDIGSMADHRPQRGRGEIGRLACGPASRLVWVVVHIAYLVGFQNRVETWSSGRGPSRTGAARSA